MANPSITITISASTTQAIQEIDKVIRSLAMMGGGGSAAAKLGRSIGNKITEEMGQAMAAAQTALRSRIDSLWKSIDPSVGGAQMIQKLRQQISLFETVLRENSRLARTKFNPLAETATEGQKALRQQQQVAQAMAKVVVSELKASLPALRGVLKQMETAFTESQNKVLQQQASNAAARTKLYAQQSKAMIAQQKQEDTEAINNARRLLKQMERDIKPTVNFQQELFRTFAGRGLLGLSAGLFAPLGVAMRGLKDVADATRTSFMALSTLLSGGRVFGALPEMVVAAGTMFRGLAGLAASGMDMFGRMVAFTMKIPSMLPALGSFKASVVGVWNTFSAMTRRERLSGMADGIRGLSGVFSEFVNVIGKVGAMAATGIAAIMRPITGLLDFAISPLTTAIGLLSMAWRFSLVAMTGATIAFVKTTTSAFVDFERRISEVLAQIPNATRAQFGQFTDIALGLSRELGKSALDITSALRLAVSVGFENVAEATEVARQSTRLATASFGDIKTATEALTNVMNSYGKSAHDAAGVSDLLFRGWQVAGGEMDDFAQGLGTISASVHAVGGSMKDLIGISALLSQSSSGNRRIFAELQQAFEQVITPRGNVNPMAMLGLNLRRTNDGGVDFVKTLTDIQKRVNQLSGGDIVRRGQILRSMFPESREFRAIARFFGSTEEHIRRTFAAVSAPGGAIQQQLTLQGQTAFRQIEIMKAAWERMKLSFGGASAAIFTPAIEGMGRFFDRIFMLIESGKFAKLREAFGKLFSAFGVGPNMTVTNALINFFANTLPSAIDRSIDKIRDIILWVRNFIAGFDLKTIYLWSLVAGQVILNAIGKLGPLLIDLIVSWTPKIVDAFMHIGWAITKAMGRALIPGPGATVGGVAGAVGGAAVGHPVGGAVIGGALGSWMEEKFIEAHKNVQLGEPDSAGVNMMFFKHGGVIPGNGVGDSIISRVRGTSDFIMLEPGEEILSRRDPRHIRNIPGAQLGREVRNNGKGIAEGPLSNEAASLARPDIVAALDAIAKLEPQLRSLYENKQLSGDKFKAFMDSITFSRGLGENGIVELLNKRAALQASAREGSAILGLTAEQARLVLPGLPEQRPQSLLKDYMAMSGQQRRMYESKLSGADRRQLLQEMHGKGLAKRLDTSLGGGFGPSPEAQRRKQVQELSRNPLMAPGASTVYELALEEAQARGLSGVGREAYAMRKARDSVFGPMWGRPNAPPGITKSPFAMIGDSEGISTRYWPAGTRPEVGYGIPPRKKLPSGEGRISGEGYDRTFSDFMDRPERYTHKQTMSISGLGGKAFRRVGEGRRVPGPIGIHGVPFVDEFPPQLPGPYGGRGPARAGTSPFGHPASAGISPFGRAPVGTSPFGPPASAGTAPFGTKPSVLGRGRVSRADLIQQQLDALGHTVPIRRSDLIQQQLDRAGHTVPIRRSDLIEQQLEKAGHTVPIRRSDLIEQQLNNLTPPQASMNSMSKSANDLAGAAGGAAGAVDRGADAVEGFLVDAHGKMNHIEARMSKLENVVNVLRSGAVS